MSIQTNHTRSDPRSATDFQYFESISIWRNCFKPRGFASAEKATALRHCAKRLECARIPPLLLEGRGRSINLALRKRKAAEYARTPNASRGSVAAPLRCAGSQFFYLPELRPNRRRIEFTPARTNRDPADCKSAIRQIKNLRYHTTLFCCFLALAAF